MLLLFSAFFFYKKKIIRTCELRKLPTVTPTQTENQKDNGFLGVMNCRQMSIGDTLSRSCVAEAKLQLKITKNEYPNKI